MYLWTITYKCAILEVIIDEYWSGYMKKVFFAKRTVAFVFIFLFFFILLSFHDYFSLNFSYAKDYYKVIDKCGESGSDPDDELCYWHKTDENVERYKRENDPVAKYKKLDAITLTCYIVEETLFNNLQLLSPLFIAILVIANIHKEVASGMVKNYFTRTDYKKYLRKNLKLLGIVSLTFPIVLCLVFLLSCLITRFNFNIGDTTIDNYIYTPFKYKHFFLYGTVICLFQYILSFAFGALALAFGKNSKNILVSILTSFIYITLIVIFINVGLYALILNKIFGIKKLSEYFMVTTYWFLGKGDNVALMLVIAICFLLFSLLVYYLSYKNKERFIMKNEKITA